MNDILIEPMVRRILLTFILFTVLLAPVSAGVGIVWSKESDSSFNGQQKCVAYGLYNPFSSDVKIILRANLQSEKEGAGSLSAESEPVEVVSHTSHSQFIPVQICFDIPNDIFEEQCLIGDFLLCEQKCIEKSTVYIGEVFATEAKDEEKGGTGSSAIAIASVPFTLKVNCVEYGMNWLPLFLIVIAILMGVVILARKLKQPRAGK